MDGDTLASRPKSTDLKPILIAPDNIRANPRNPRKQFPRASLERLIDSIEKIGVLVPLTVYRDENNESEYVLLDGERRWRAACEINRPKVPAWVIAKPTEADNAVRMFNIHMLRDDWDEMETAWALKQIIDETGVSDDKELQHLTGLSVDRIGNMKRVLAFPKEHQDLVHNGEVPYNLLVELDKTVLSRARREPKIAKKNDKRVLTQSPKELRDIFLRKYRDGVYKDVVDLRKVSALIRTAAGAEGQTAERAQSALDNLITDASATIDEAYEVGAPGSLELPRILRDVRNLPERLRALQSMTVPKESRRQLVAAIRALRTTCQETLRKFQ